MNKKVQIIRINFTDFWEGFDIYTSFFYKLLAKNYNIEISEKPEILFYSVFGNSHKRYNCTKVFFTGENIRPDFKSCDFAFSFDYPVTDKNYRLPLYALYDDVTKLVNRKIDAKAELLRKKKFCCFIVSNPSNQIRNDFFLALSRHKHVESAGTVFNNIGGTIENKRDFIKDYKFVIAFENSSYPGYVTEKIFEPLLEDCVPIYWGDKLIHKDFNPARFINCHDFENFEAVIQHILAVDADDTAYLKYLNASVFNEDKLPSFLDNKNIMIQLDNIIQYTNEKSLKKLMLRNKRRLVYILNKLKINSLFH
ncbi:MAG: glycosyltransferase family 10 [Bacteroidota bacterium]